MHRVLFVGETFSGTGPLSALAEMVEVLILAEEQRARSDGGGCGGEGGEEAVEAADDLVQRGLPELAHGILTAVESARGELREADDSPSPYPAPSDVVGSGGAGRDPFYAIFCQGLVRG